MAKFLARLFQKSTTTEDDRSSKNVFGIGCVIDQKYRITAEIGRGGMGIVYRAHDLRQDHDVALKIIDENQLNDLTLQQFLRESRIHLQLQQPHIARVYEVGTVRSEAGQALPFLVMELLQGTPLHQMHEFTYARVIDIGKQICDALAYIHEQGFLYRDLKPGNVILEKCGFHYCVKLIDFGLARPRDEAYLPNESTRAGTVFYLAPELIAGQPADIGADLYALGATLYEMMTGRVPFSNIDEQNILSQHLQEKVAPPSDSRSDVPAALEAIVLRLLEKDPKDRFGSAREVLEALNAIQLADTDMPRGNLPAVDLANRAPEIEAVVKLLESSRIVTVLGDRGALIQAAGTRLLSEFTNGAWFVNLDAVEDPALVLRTVASALGVRESSNRPLALSLVESLRDQNLLLLLGPCGHLAAACAQLCETILRTCPEAYILAASDRPLNIPAEMCFDARDLAANSASTQPT